VLVGEVWLCSGQSNMQWTVAGSCDSDLETVAPRRIPGLRLITVPQVGTQVPQDDFDGQWVEATPESVPEFSGVGFFFGRLLHQILEVPVGLIDNAWGGSSAEAWVRRDLLEKDPAYAALMDNWRKIEATYRHEDALARHRKIVEAWKAKAAQAKATGMPTPLPPRAPIDQLKGQHRPGNLYCGVLHPIIGFGMRGAIWYQG